jgi:hypothetical protein
MTVDSYWKSFDLFYVFVKELERMGQQRRSRTAYFPPLWTFSQKLFRF